jgi:thioredoxin 1
MSSDIEEVRKKKMAEMMDRAKTGESGGWPAAPVKVTDLDFEAILKKYPKLVVDCWAPWCGPCRMLSPTIEAMAKDQSGSVVFAKLNTDENYGTAGKFRISGIPTLLFFKDGTLVDKVVGAAPREMIEDKIKSAFGE